MSFSTEVKEELETVISGSRHCQLAELAAIVHFGCRVRTGKDGAEEIAVTSENPFVTRKYFTLLKKTYIINNVVDKIFQAIKVLDERGQARPLTEEVDPILLKNSCCRRAFLRGAFLAAGSISDPEKFYHYEIACTAQAKAGQIRSILSTFDIDARIVQRKKYFVVYVKEGNQIVTLLNVMEAPIALMELENIRILKGMRGSVNRQVNCETANINKTVSAAVKQIEDITYIRDVMGLDQLQEGLCDIAKLRLERPEATLKELGEALDPPVGKSGVNHRLRKLSILAEELREKSRTSEMQSGGSE